MFSAFLIKKKQKQISENEKITVFYDADCSLCTRLGDFLQKLASKPKNKTQFLFLNFNSNIAKNLQLQNQNSIVVLAKKKTLLRSQAVVAICRQLGFPWKILAASLALFPTTFLDRLYDKFAENRFRFSKRKSCKLTPK